MASFFALNLTPKHWRILDAIERSPTGTAKQPAIQEYFGTSAMMEVLEQLYDSGWIENTYQMTVPGRPPRRNPHEFRMSADARLEYAKRRPNAPKGADEPIAEPPPAPAEDQEPRGRPPGAKNRPKAETPSR